MVACGSGRLPKPSAEELVTLDAKGRKARIAA